MLHAKTTFFMAAALLLFACNDTPDSQQAPVIDTALVKQGFTVKKENVHPFEPVDASPMDMSYFPVDYPHVKHTLQEHPVMRIIYSRPQKKGRVVYGNLVKYDQIWRLGANEATEIEFFQPVTIQGKKVPVGRYTLYCVAHKDNWQIVLNGGLYGWGLEIDISKDLMNFTASIATTTNIAEYFTAVFEKSDTGANLVFAWDNLVARLPIVF
jgi:hypothetical protein